MGCSYFQPLNLIANIRFLKLKSLHWEYRYNYSINTKYKKYFNEIKKAVIGFLIRQTITKVVSKVLP